MNTTLIYYTEELVYDIKGRAFAMARSKTDKGETPAKDDAWLIDVAREDWSDTMCQEIAGRLMTLAFGKCQNILASICSDVAEEDYVGSDRFKTAERYIMKLTYSSSVKEGQIKYLKALIHEFIVYYVLLEWCELVAPEHTEMLANRSAELESALQSLLSQFGKAKERKYFPF